MTTGATYEATRVGLNMSRAQVSAMSKRAGHCISESALKRLEAEGSTVVGARGLRSAAVEWIDYLYGLVDPTGLIDWEGVEQGAPVLILGEKGTYALHEIIGGVITVWGGLRNRESFRTLPIEGVRLIASSALPPASSASIFETRYRGIDATYGSKILAHMKTTGSACSVGQLAYTLGIDNVAVSRVAAALAKRGELRKVQRGVFVLADTDPEVEAASVKSALAERVMAQR